MQEAISKGSFDLIYQWVGQLDLLGMWRQEIDMQS